MTSDRNNPPLWSSSVAFYLGAMGGAVGLGSIWRFPYLAGTNGGGAFVFVFLISCLSIAMPLLIAEFLIGRRARASPAEAAGIVAQSSGLSRRWNVIGRLGTVATFMIMSYYTVIAGWVLAYTWKLATGSLNGLDRSGVAALWREFLASPLQLGLWHLAFVILVGVISACGLHRGIEAVSKFRAPALLVLLLILVAYSLATGDVQKGLAFAFAPDFAAITPQVALAAIGQAFFATGVGMAMMLAYGAYVQPDTSLTRCALIIVGSILLVSVLATLMIFPLVFRYGLDPAQGFELIFNVLPNAFAEMPGGHVVGTLFFLLLIFAALTPSLAGIEPLVGWLQQRHGFERAPAALTAAAGCWLIGIGSMLSFNAWSDWHPLAMVPAFRNLTLFGLMDYIASNVLLPVGALITSIFVGWRLKRSLVDEQLGDSSRSRGVIVWLLRWLCPIAILAMLVGGIA